MLASQLPFWLSAAIHEAIKVNRLRDENVKKVQARHEQLMHKHKRPNHFHVGGCFKSCDA